MSMSLLFFNIVDINAHFCGYMFLEEIILKMAGCSQKYVGVLIIN
jgi:predicted MFS family arabinose efflux permease